MTGRRPTRDELELFGKVLADARPLSSDKTSVVEVEIPPTRDAASDTPSPTRRKAAKRAGTLTPKAVPQLSPSHLDQHARDGAPHGKAPGLDRRLQLRLKRGQLPIEARVDLHGLSREKARAVLNGFVARQTALGRRCVLVITGKGRPDWQRPTPDEGSPDAGVIRRALPEWLRDNANKEKVLAFAPAQPRDGGAGAWYVLLRRRRDDAGREGGR
ncbi:MAG: Smr/MutS family protein [Alphaproteobacteria bacterium]|nr:Smr/MutS family protein [Alphaproteobacteria bacterium]